MQTAVITTMRVLVVLYHVSEHRFPSPPLFSLPSMFFMVCVEIVPLRTFLSISCLQYRCPGAAVIQTARARRWRRLRGRLLQSTSTLVRQPCNDQAPYLRGMFSGIVFLLVLAQDFNLCSSTLRAHALCRSQPASNYHCLRQFGCLYKRQTTITAIRRHLQGIFSCHRCSCLMLLSGCLS